MKERVRAPDTRKHLATLAEATLAYVGATSSNIKYLLVENEQLTKNLQAARQGEKQSREQSAVSAMAEMRKVILVVASRLDTTMWKLYDEFFHRAKSSCPCAWLAAAK